MILYDFTFKPFGYAWSIGCVMSFKTFGYPRYNASCSNMFQCSVKPFWLHICHYHVQASGLLLYKYIMIIAKCLPHIYGREPGRDDQAKMAACVLY